MQHHRTVIDAIHQGVYCRDWIITDRGGGLAGTLSGKPGGLHTVGWCRAGKAGIQGILLVPRKTIHCIVCRVGLSRLLQCRIDLHGRRLRVRAQFVQASDSLLLGTGARSMNRRDRRP